MMPKWLTNEEYAALLADQQLLTHYKQIYESTSARNKDLLAELDKIKNGLSLQQYAYERSKKEAEAVSASAKLSVQAARQEARNAKERSKRLKDKNSELIQRLRDFTTDVSRL